jgi:flavin-binding protein dodecin
MAEMVKVIEVVGSSEKSWEDAVQHVVGEAAMTLRHIRAVDVIKQTAHVKDGRICEYRVTMHIAFLVEHHSQLVGARAEGR